VDTDFYAEYFEMEDRHWWFVGRRQILLRVLERELSGNHAERILDVGCGTGTMLGHLSRFGHAAGVDAEPDAVHLCQKRGVRGVQIYDGSTLPFETEAFTLVTTLDVLEHIDDDSGMLAEIHRVLAPGGTLLITVPAFPFLWGPQDELSHHKRRYRRQELRERVESAGFELRRLSYFNMLLFPPIAAIRALRPYRPGDQELRSDFEMTKPGRVNDLLARVFAAEGPLIARANLPVGVSLLAVAKRG
jgi:SAM-dependent methyltransferase